MAARIRGLAPGAAVERAAAVAGMLATPVGRRALRWTPRSVAALRLVRALLAHGVRPATVIDVGANSGQFARAAVELFDCPVHSFEPLPEAADAFMENLADRREVHLHRTALGAREGSTAFFPHEYSLASSVLPQAVEAPATWTDEQEPIDVPITRLDDALAPGALLTPILLKLDVQGFELEVLAGAPRTLARSDALVVELAFEAAYRDQPLAADVLEVLADAGWRLNALLDVHRERGRIVEADALLRPQR